MTAPAHRRGVRAAYLVVYGLFAALGAALLARPALLTARGLGLLGPALPWRVPLGPVALLIALLVAAFTLALAVSLALGRKPRVASHAVFLGLLGLAVALRMTAGEAAPPEDPGPALLAALRTTAAACDARYAQAKAYAVDEALLDAALAGLPRPGFRRFGRQLPLRSRVVPRSQGPAFAPAEADLPGTVLVAVSPDASRIWLTVLTLREGRVAPLTSEGRPVVLQARAGTHSAPGRDPVVPAYPSMRAVGRGVR